MANENVRVGQLTLEEIIDPTSVLLSDAVVRSKSAIGHGRVFIAELADFLRREIEEPSGGRVPWVRRSLDLLSALGCDDHILSLKTRLQSHPDAHVRSKATLMVGRASKNLTWISRCMLDSDPRVQANAIESMWGTNTKEYRAMLESASKSPHHRVAANALVGLHRLQDVGSIPRLFAMAEHESEMFRLAAHWAMGATDDPRFLPFLTKLFESGQGGRRAMLMRSLSRLRRRMTALEKLAEIKIAVWENRILEGGGRSIGISLLRAASDDAVTLSATEIVITENSNLIAEYTLKALPEPDRLAAGFSIPRILSRVDEYRLATEAGLTRCAEIRPAGDLWILDRFRSGAHADSDDEAQESLVDAPEDPLLERHLRLNRGFLRETEMIAKVIPGPGHKDKASRDFAESFQKLTMAVGRTSASRHLFVFFDPEQPLEESETAGLIAVATEDSITIHCIAPDSATDTDAFRRLSSATGGRFLSLPPGRITEELPRLYQSLRNRYQINYPAREAGAEPATVELKLYLPQGCGTASTQLG